MNEALVDDDEGGMDPASLQTLYAKALYRLRESRKALLKQHAVADEAQLLERIRSGEVLEHPAYEHYLSALIMEQGRMQLREELLGRFGGRPSTEVPAIGIHLLLKEQVEEAYASSLTEPVRLAQDALLMSFDNGLMMEVRCFSSDEFSIHWSWGDAELRLDTAPVHAGMAGFPRHLHRDDGTVVEDPVDVSDPDPCIAFSRLLDVLLADPLLEGR
ncbi:MAG TPA: hypothetical protein VEC35_07185 [Noviherbaspirillum sp.]|nr:hypothetical protein [Noviherbaspirillum sp.]